MAGETRVAGLLAEPNGLPRLDHDAVGAYTLAIRSLPRDAVSGTPRRFRDDGQRGVTRVIGAARPDR